MDLKEGGKGYMAEFVERKLMEEILWLNNNLKNSN